MVEAMRYEAIHAPHDHIAAAPTIHVSDAAAGPQGRVVRKGTGRGDRPAWDCPCRPRTARIQQTRPIACVELQQHQGCMEDQY